MIIQTRISTRFASLLWNGLAMLLLAFPVYAQQPASSGEVQRQVETAIEVFDSFVKLNLPPRKRALLDEALKDAHGFAIFQKFLKLGTGVSGIQGRGGLSYRDRDGEWSPPIPLLVQGTSSGPDLGAVL